MEIAEKIISNVEIDENPVDTQYKYLQTEIIPLEHNNEEFLLIKEYVNKTHAPTHNTYTLDVLEVFKIERFY